MNKAEIMLYIGFIVTVAINPILGLAVCVVGAVAADKTSTSSDIIGEEKK